MSLAIELIANAATTLSLGGGFWLFKWWRFNNKRARNLHQKLEGVYLWEDTNEGCSFQCPKCECKIQGQPPICSCEEYHSEHFHFKCEGKPLYSCGYSCIIRTKDDVY